jgi:iron complex transport system ATP-binding protein
MPLLQVVNARFDYKDKQVFHNVGFSVEPGEICCVFGPNGCGKSTLLECVLGILKLSEGEIFIEGDRVFGMSPAQLARHAAFVPQLHEKTFPYTVLDFVLMGRAAYTGLLGTPKIGDTEAALSALKTLGIADFKNRPYTQLSGGELQMVMLARALAQQTPLIVLDEPTSHLDFKNDIAILETIANLVTQKGLAVLMATHFPNQAFFFEYHGLPVKVLMMADHGIQKVGKPSEVFTRDNMLSVFGVESRVITCEVAPNAHLRQIVPLGSEHL